MEFSQQMNKDILVIGLKGRLDMSNSDALKENFSTWLQSARKFVFDCSALEFLDSTGLGVLLLCLKEAMKTDGDIRLAQVNETVHMVLEITRADEIFQVFPTVKEAVASFS
jgi:anti-sigma B factor antagonist